MNAKCKYYCVFYPIIFGLVAVGLFFMWFDWWEIIPCRITRIVLALIIVIPIGALLQWSVLFKLGWKIIQEAEKGQPKSDKKTRDIPYSFATAFGTFERCLYLIILLAGKPEGIFLWLGFKAVAKWGQPENKTEWIKSKPFNLSLVGELTNIFLALVGALLIVRNTKTLISLFH
jgi:hypothetical protein